MSEDPESDPSQPLNPSNTSIPLLPIPPLEMPSSNLGKRRPMSISAATLRSEIDATLANHPPAKVAAFGHASSQESVTTFPSCDVRSSKRKRLVFYCIAFATMLALSSVLDIRRAELRHRQPKVQLSLPAGSSISSLADHTSNNADPLPPPEPPLSSDSRSKSDDPNLSLRPAGQPGSESTSEHDDHASSPTLSSGGGVRPPPSSDSDPPSKPTDPNLSDQELKDDVDQLIAHVDQETNRPNTTATTSERDSATSPTVDRPMSPSKPSSVKPPPDGVSGDPTSDSGETDRTIAEDAAPQGGNSSQPTAGQTELRLNSEEHFRNAQKRMTSILSDETLKKHADENDLRLLQALSLQSTHGDCEQKSGSEGGSLFKTDAEAAANVDIERTDPLWGAWCLFMGSYKTDAMRDYVTKQRVVEDKIMKAKISAEINETSTDVAFDPHAASLNDVLTMEQQSALKLKMDTLSQHLSQNDVRYLAALSLQATLGDCGPFGKEKASISKEGEGAVELRKLQEPILEQAAERRRGAQWGAWCVLQGTKRKSAATELSRRVDLLIVQLSKSQAASRSKTSDSEDELAADSASVHTSDTTNRADATS